MESPVGDTAFCESEVDLRVTKALRIIDAIAELPDEHCALHLLRYQMRRMEYTARTTPFGCCSNALGRFENGTRVAYGKIVGKFPSDDVWAQVTLPVRSGGLGLRSMQAIAPAACYSSRAATWQRWPYIQLTLPLKTIQCVTLNNS